MAKRIEDIDRYLRATFAAESIPRPSTDESASVQRPFLTISREAGVGGHALADAIVAVFESHPDSDTFGGWHIYDKSLCEIVAGDPQYSRNLEALRDEEYRSRASDFFHQMLRATVNQDLVMKKVFLVVRAVAGMGKAIIVGRAGAQVTADLPAGVSIRVVASERDRAAWAAKRLGLEERDATTNGARRDADRARLVRSHFGVDIADPTGYDAVFNASRMSHDEIAEAVVSLVAHRVEG